MLISVAQLMVVLDATIANIALPFIKVDLGISQANLSWIVTGYSLAFGGLLLLGGRLGDLYGRRRMFMVGVSIFAVASLLGGFASTEGCCSAPVGCRASARRSPPRPRSRSSPRRSPPARSATARSRSTPRCPAPARLSAWCSAAG